MTITIGEAIKQLQCVGCVSGSDPNTCPAYTPAEGNDGCGAHCSGTSLGGVGRIHLGMPKGFSRVGALQERYGQTDNTRLFIENDPAWSWDYLNVPVWYRFDGTFTYVRTFLPRIGSHYVDVFFGDRTQAVLAANPSAFNVADFEDEID